jgi:hypothetical protein
VRVCSFLGLVWRGVGTGRGEFLLGIGMIEADIASGDTFTAIDPNGRPGTRRLADEEASDCTVAVDGRMQNSASGMSKEDTLDHVRAGETCSATKNTFAHLVIYSHVSPPQGPTRN